MLTKKLLFVLAIVSVASLNCAKSLNGSKINSRIVNGDNATKDQFPYYAQLISLQLQQSYFGEVYETESFCGGAVIGRKHVVTAAHCLTGFLEALIVYLAYYANSDTKDLVRRDVDVYWIHQGFSYSTLKNDIGLVRWVDPIEYSYLIQPIALYCYNADTPANTSVQVAGHGVTNDTNQDLPKYLEYADFRTLSIEECREYYSFTTPENICIFGTLPGTDRQYTCYGDSGSCMVQMMRGIPVHIGIVSYGSSKGCADGYPDSFTRTSNYTDWLDGLVGDDKFTCAQSLISESDEDVEH